MIGKFESKIRKKKKLFLRWFLKCLSKKLEGNSFYIQSEMDISQRSLWNSSSFVEQTGGFYPKGDAERREIIPVDCWDQTRRDMLILLLRTLEERKVAGVFAELGVYKGFTAKLINSYCPDRELHLFDTFAGFTDRSVKVEGALTGEVVSSEHFADTSIEKVKEYINSDSKKIHYHIGYFPESIPNNLINERFAFVHLDADLFEPIFEGLKFFYPRMSENGIIVIHDYNAWVGSRQAVDKFCIEHDVICIPMPDKSGSAIIIKK